jgi:hypothetical protein
MAQRNSSSSLPPSVWPDGAERTTSHRPHRCTILPPYLLQQVALNAGGAARESSLTTLLLDEGFRSTRQVSTAARARSGPAWRGVPAPLSGAGVDRAIHDAEHTQQLPGKLVRSEGQADSPDVAVNEAYDGLGDTYQLYAEQYDRDSIDDQGMQLSGSVHYDENYDNAFWDGTQMVFGDGDGDIFNRFTISVDVIGHELTHGVTEKEAGLVYSRQSGALNESISDVFGSLVKQFAEETSAADADWLIGEGLFTNKVQGVALRSMKEPGTAYDDPVLGKDPQPANMDGYVVTSADSGGVHINSGIPNHAFYLAAVEIDGYAWEKAGRIWYETLRSPRMRPRMGFRGFAALTSLTAAQLFGRGSPEAKAVRGAWRAVGLGRPAPGAARGKGARGARALGRPVGRPVGRIVKSSSSSPWLAGAGDGDDERGAGARAPRAAASPAKRGAARGGRARSRTAKTSKTSKASRASKTSKTAKTAQTSKST